MADVHSSTSNNLESSKHEPKNLELNTLQKKNHRTALLLGGP